MIEVDVKQLLIPGVFRYSHSIYGEVKSVVYPIGEEQFWVVEELAHLVIGAISKTGPHGLYTGGGKALEAPTAAPPPNYQATEFVLHVPSSFRNAEPLVVIDEQGEDGRRTIELIPSIIKQGEEDIIVVRMRANDGIGMEIEVEEWWRQGIGVVRRSFITPPLGEMELLDHKPLG